MPRDGINKGDTAEAHYSELVDQYQDVFEL